MEEKTSILIVDDDESARRALTLIFAEKGYESETAGTGRQAIEKARERFFNLALLDIKLPDMEGVELLAPLKEIHPDIVMIMITAYASLETAVRALNAGASAYITKPLNMDEVLATVREALKKQHIVMENRRLYEVAQQELAERKQAEEALKTSRANFHSIVEMAPEGIIIVDREGIVRFINPSAEALLGRKADEYVGELFGFSLVPDEAFEVDILCKGGGIGIAEVRVIETTWQETACHLISLIDISAIKTVEETLKKANEELTKLSQIKADFISTASHELRTPMTSIKNAIDLNLKRKAGDVTEVQERFLSMAMRNIDRLVELLNELLDISRMEAKKRKLDFAKMHIRHCIENATNTVKHLANEKSITLETIVDPDLPPTYSDPERIDEVIINLLGNAIKFTPENGTITVHARQIENLSGKSRAMKHFLCVSVTDNGVGIPADSIDNVFEKFYQVEQSLSAKKQKGSGLGLSISKLIVEMHGGTIQCESKEGEGSTFSFTIPIINMEKHFYNGLDDELLRAGKEDKALSILLCKINESEQYSKVYDDREPEEVLQLVKDKIMKGRVKKTDIIVRSPVNGELLLIMCDTDSREATIVKERIEEYVTVDYPSFMVGTATFPEDGASAKEMVTFARKCMTTSNRAHRKA